MAKVVDWSLNDSALRKKLLQLSKSKLIKACKYKNVSHNGSKNDIIDRILKTTNTKKQTKSKRKTTKKSKILNKNKILILPDPPKTKINLTTHNINLKQRRFDLVNGYTRINYFKIIAMIPLSIIDICVTYLSLSEEWNTDCIAPYIRIEGNGDICVNTSNVKRIQSDFGRNIVKSGYHKWKLKILKYNAAYQKENMIIGLIKHDYCDTYFDKDFTYSSYSVGFIGSEGAYDDWQYGKKVQAGDVVEMHFDMKNCTVKYIINGHDYGCCFDHYDIGKYINYRLAVTIIGKGSSIQIVDYHNTD